MTINAFRQPVIERGLQSSSHPEHKEGLFHILEEAGALGNRATAVIDYGACDHLEAIASKPRGSVDLSFLGQGVEEELGMLVAAAKKGNAYAKSELLGYQDNAIAWAMIGTLMDIKTLVS